MHGSDSSPFGFDPMFVATSPLYNGKLIASEHYLPSERTNATKMQALPGGLSTQVCQLCFLRLCEVGWC